MHQDHNIPWHLLASHLKYKVFPDGSTPKANFIPSEKASETQDLRHFARKVAAAIADFSKTERAKYPDKFDAPDEGKFFSPDTLWDIARVAAKDQIEVWISRRQEAASGRLRYSTAHGDLADNVKLLLTQEDQTPLLMLAQHPKVPLLDLKWLCWGHSFGFVYAGETTLSVYLMINFLAAADFLHNPSVRDLGCWNQVIRWATQSMDYDAQNALQWQCLGRDENQEADTLLKTAEVYEYLKKAWRVIYRYDMLLRELGDDPKWEEMVRQLLYNAWGFKGLGYG